MKSIRQRLEENYILGCIKYSNQYHFYIMPIAWWILDYENYDPSILTDDKFNFRNGVYKVTDDKIGNYLNSIADDEITLIDTKDIMLNHAEEYSRVTFFIDFDEKQFINGFFDIEVTDYLPDQKWIGKFDWEPINYIPKEVLL